MYNTYQVKGRVNCILSPLGDKQSVLITNNFNSVIKQPKNKIGKALIKVYIYNEDINHIEHGWDLTIEDKENKIKKLEDWIYQILVKVECRIIKYITRENFDHMLESMIELRHDIKTKITNANIKSS